jgi:hypothetical protein
LFVDTLKVIQVCVSAANVLFASLTVKTSHFFFPRFVPAPPQKQSASHGLTFADGKQLIDGINV